MTQNDKKIYVSLWSAVFMNQYFNGDSSSNWAPCYYTIKVCKCVISAPLKTIKDNRDLKSSLLEQDFSNFFFNDLLTKIKKQQYIFLYKDPSIMCEKKKIRVILRRQHDNLNYFVIIFMNIIIIIRNERKKNNNNNNYFCIKTQ